MNVESSPPAFLISATYVVDPADAPKFREIAARMAERAASREGCSFLHATQDLLDAQTFRLIESWASWEAFNEYAASDEFQAVLKEALALRILDRSGTMFFVSSAEALEMPS